MTSKHASEDFIFKKPVMAPPYMKLLDASQLDIKL